MDKARVLLDALKATRLTFKQVYDIAVRFHDPILSYFGCDMGMKLMNRDGAIALDVLSHFAERQIPVLGCHDSFIVPAEHAAELSYTMLSFYSKRMGGHDAIVTECEAAPTTTRLAA